jgi:hypothetical protein
MLRGLSINPKTGLINPKGTVKASWIAEAFGLSIRAVKSARAELISLGYYLIKTLTHIRENLTGMELILSLTWSGQKQRVGEKVRLKLWITLPRPKLNLHPLSPQNSTEFAPPIERLKTSKENKNQKTWNSKSTGVCNQTFKEKNSPNIRDIQPEDFREFARNEILYWQAVNLGLIRHSEANALNWVSASIRARETENPARIFMGIIKKKLFHHVTQAQEEIARNAIKRRREKHFDAYRIQSEQRLAA